MNLSGDPSRHACCAGGLDQAHVFLRVEIAMTQKHSRGEVGGEAEPADGNLIAPEVSRRFDVVAHDESEREPIDINADQLTVEYSNRNGVQHCGNIRIGDVDIPTDHGLGHRRAAGEVNQPDVEAAFFPQSRTLDSFVKIFGAARAAIPNPDKRLSGDVSELQAKYKGDDRDKRQLFSPSQSPHSQLILAKQIDSY
jgi:hypothetical protein